MNDSPVSDLILTKTRIADGVWEGKLQTPQAQPDAPAPAISVTLGDTPVSGVELEPADGMPGLYLLRVPIPQHALGEGIHTFLIVDDDSGAALGDFSIALGMPLETDIRTELNQLRAELDLLKRAFRRHCTETM